VTYGLRPYLGDGTTGASISAPYNHFGLGPSRCLVGLCLGPPEIGEYTIKPVTVDLQRLFEVLRCAA